MTLWQVDIPATSQRLRYRTLPEVGEDAFIDATERISAASRDRRAQTGRVDSSAAQEARATFHELQGMEYEPDWWQLAYAEDRTLVGLVIPTRSPRFVTIGYIGVVPEQRGHGYIDDLLAHGTVILQRTDAETIITDTDIANFPMANAFRRAGDTEFTTRREYILRGTTAWYDLDRRGNRVRSERPCDRSLRTLSIEHGASVLAARYRLPRTALGPR